MDAAKRNAIWKLLDAIATAADPVMGPDLQLMGLNITITAAEDSLEDIREKATAADARWTEEEEDLFS